MTKKRGHGTGIEWTHLPGYKGETWNPLHARNRETGDEGWSCARVSDGCKFCYAATQNETRRFGRGTGLDYTVPNLDRVEHVLDERTLQQPLHWRDPRSMFVCSMTDLFGEWVPDDFIDRVFATMALTPQHIYFVLTKRPGRMRAYIDGLRLRVPDVLADFYVEAPSRAALAPLTMQVAQSVSRWPLPNVWLGASVEDQATADERIPLLLDTPAAVRFVSAEPLLGPIDFWRANSRAFDNFGWLICGGESGKEHRDLDLAWVAPIYQYCQETEVPWFGKQRSGVRPGLPLPAPYDAKAWPEVVNGQR